MKKLYSFVLAALCSAGAMATTQVPNYLGGGNLQRDFTVKPGLEYVETTPAVAQAEATTDATAPESIVGNSYVTIYKNGNNSYNYFFNVKEGTDGGIILEGFAEGYDVNANYNAATGKITIPTKGAIIGNNSTYGDIALYALVNNGTQYSDADITGTYQDGKFVFDNGVCGKVSAGGLIVMNQITGNPANAKITYSMTNNTTQETVTFVNPLLVTKATDTTLKFVGFSGILYGAYFEVPFIINEANKTVYHTFQSSPVDYIATQSATRTYYLAGVNPIGLVDDQLTMAVVTSDNTSLLTVATMMYVYPNGTQYSGYKFTDVKIDIDFNIFTGEATSGDDNDDDTDTPTIGGINYSLDRDAKTATVTGCIATLTDLNIPAEITVANVSYAVTTVNASAFLNNKVITSATIPASVTTVGTDAFRNLANLKSLYIADLAAWCAIDFANGNANPVYNVYPTSTSKWGKVYVNGQQATTLDIPEGVTSIGRAFYGFKALTAVTLPSSLVTMGDQVFANCTNLTEIVIPENVESMGSVFFGCSGLKKATINGAVKTYKNTFYGCKALESVNIPEGAESIGAMSFNNCSSLTELTLPSTLKELGMMAFDGCSGLTQIKSYATAPAAAQVCAFDGIDTTIPVYVPAGTVDAYKAAAEWMNFTNYQEFDTSGIEDVEIDNNDAPAEYYTLQGVKVANPTAGLYIKKQGKTTSKILVK